MAREREVRGGGMTYKRYWKFRNAKGCSGNARGGGEGVIKMRKWRKRRGKQSRWPEKLKVPFFSFTPVSRLCVYIYIYFRTVEKIPRKIKYIYMVCIIQAMLVIITVPCGLKETVS